MNLPAFLEYKHGNAPWLAKIPAHWETKRLKFMANVCNGRDQKEVLNDDGAYDIFGSGGVFGKSSEYLYDQVSVLLGRKGTIDKPIYIDRPFWTVDTMFYTQIAKEVHPKYFFYLCLTIPFDFLRDQTTLPSMTQSGLSGVRFAFAPPGEQQQIAAFLDWKTGQIDALIGKKKELLEKLKEKRIAIITQAVTQGLNPAVPLRDSGIPWLGQVPQHWEVKKFSYFSRVVRGASPRPAGDPTYFNGDYIPWITVGEITKDELIYLESTETMLTEEGAQNSRTMTAGTLVITNSGATLGVPKILSITGCANDGVVAFEDLAENVDKVFLYFFLRSQTEELRERMKQGGGQPNLNTDIIKALAVPFPPIEEQTRIAEHLRGATAKLDKMTAKVAQAIDRLTEYRTALITAATTGKIDVRKVKIPQPAA